MRLLVLLLLSFFLVPAAILAQVTEAASAPDVIEILNYQNDPPFKHKSSQGVLDDLAHYLTLKSAGKYTFKVKDVPRKRVTHLIDSGKGAFVPLVDQRWFKLPEGTEHVWTPPLINSNAVVLVKNTDPLNYEGLPSLKDYTFVGISGYHYSEFRNGTLPKPAQWLERKSLTGLLDVVKERDGVFSMTTLTLWRATARYHGITEIRAIDLGERGKVARRILVANHSQDIRDFVDQSIKDMISGSDWANILDQYDLADLAPGHQAKASLE